MMTDIEAWRWMNTIRSNQSVLNGPEARDWAGRMHVPLSNDVAGIGVFFYEFIPADIHRTAGGSVYVRQPRGNITVRHLLLTAGYRAGMLDQTVPPSFADHLRSTIRYLWNLPPAELEAEVALYLLAEGQS